VFVFVCFFIIGPGPIDLVFKNILLNVLFFSTIFTSAVDTTSLVALVALDIWLLAGSFGNTTLT